MFAIFGQDWRWLGDSPEPSADGGGRLGIRRKIESKKVTPRVFGDVKFVILFV